MCIRDSTIRDRVPWKAKRILMNTEQKFEENDVKLDVKNQLRIWWGCFVGNTRFSQENGPRRWNNEADSTEMTSKFLQNWREFWGNSKRDLMKNEFIFYEALFKEINVLPGESSRPQWKNDPDNMKTKAKFEETRRNISRNTFVILLSCFHKNRRFPEEISGTISAVSYTHLTLPTIYSV